LLQLTEGLMCLHAHGKVHRDVKPSNVLVTDDGRVVLLDFGLAVDVSRQARSEVTARQAAGTALYMSPEQARGDPVGPASDWYSVGVLLYETLAGRLPFYGTTSEVLDRKQEEDPPAPTAFASDVPEDLDRLCLALLARDPRQRAGGAEVLSVLSASGQGATGAAVKGIGIARFVGRRAELSALESAFVAMSGEPLRVVIQGESGVGKTSLVREFCHRRALQADALPSLVCTGACSERESVAFKALDGIVEGLAEAIPEIIAAESTAPTGSARLVECVRAAGLAFPALMRSFSDGAVSSPSDPWIRREVAFQGMRDLLGIVARHRRVIAFIDDWQWVDADSVRLLSHVLSGPGAPPLFLLLTSRSSHFADLPGTSERLALGNLEREAAEQLATEQLEGMAGPSRAPLAREIAAESLGHPLFIAALARQLLAGEDLVRARPNLEDAIWSRVAALPIVAREMVELVAVSRTPLLLRVLRLALAEAGEAISWPALSGAIVLLARDNLARADGIHPNATIDCFHSRVASSVLARIERPIQRARHRALAVALEESQSADFESMTEHWAEAEQPERAAGYALQAADAAVEHLAFDRAARLYRRCLELWPGQGGAATVHEKLATALAHIGRGRAAADAYLVAAAAEGERRLELQRLAADQLFRSGYVDDAIRLIERVFPSVGLRFPTSARQALFWLAVRRVRIRLRGIEFQPRPADKIAPAARARVDAAWTVAVGLSTVDNLKGACVQSDNLLLALELGEPFRVVRALAAEAAYVATVGTKARAKADALLKRASEIAAQLADPYALGFVHLARCFALYLRSEFTAARAAGEAAEAVFEERPIMAPWELTSARMLHLSTHFYSGDLREILRRVPALVREAEGRGDLYGATCLRLGICNCAWLVDDEAGEARRNLRVADESWHYQGVHLQHGWSLVASGNVDLYEGKAEHAYARVQESLPALERSFVMRFERLRAELLWLRARTALAHAATDGLVRGRSAADGKGRARLLAEAEVCGKRLLGESAPWAPAAGHLALAGVQAVQGRWAGAREHAAIARTVAQATDFQLLVRVSTHFLGDASALEGVVARPDRWMSMLAPGLAAGPSEPA
jgi:hypothetical protein